MRTLIFTLLIACSGLLKAQDPPEYSFQVLQGTYQELQGLTPLTGTDPWFGADWNIPIGFDFEFMGQVSSNIYVEEDFFYFNDDENLYLTVLGPFLQDRCYSLTGCALSVSPVGYQTVGSPGERITQIQYQNAGFTFGTAVDSLDFQVWLYEDEYTIEIHIGPNQISPGAYFALGYTGGVFGLADEANELYLYITGDPASPTLETFADENFDALNGMPANGTIYRFFTGDPVQQTEVAVQPDSKAWFNGNSIQYQYNGIGHPEEIRLFDQQGRLLLLEKGPNHSRGELYSNQLIAGMYYLQFLNGGRAQTTKVAVIPQ